MIIEVLESFYRDVQSINNKRDRIKILDRIKEIESIEHFHQIPNLKKLKGSKIKFRIRVGNFRIGIFYENDILQFSRVLDRKKFYRGF